MRERLRDIRHRMLTRTGLPPWLEPLTHPFRIIWVLYRRMNRDKAFLRAAGMAYASLVALVPLLLLLFGALEATGVLQRNPEAIEALIFGSFLGNIPEVREFLLPGLLQVDLGAMGLVGIGGLTIVAARLYIQVENAYCEILGVEIERPLCLRLLLFYVAVTLAPVVLTAMFLRTWELSSDLGLSDATSIVTNLVQFVILLAAMRGFPGAAVRWGPATFGTLVTVALLDVASWGFRRYLVLFGADDPVRVIYGSVGVLPVFLLWLYLAWLTVLIGVEVATIAQNHESMFQAEFAEAFEDHAARIVPGDDTALVVALHLASWFDGGKGPMLREDVAHATGLRQVDVAPVLRALEVAGIVVRAGDGWLLARPSATIALSDVLSAWRARTSPHRADDRDVTRLRALMDAQLRGTLADAPALLAAEVGRLRAG